ncbi:MAG: Na+/H+ antiporter subunit E [Bacillota bacterium]
MRKKIMMILILSGFWMVISETITGENIIFGLSVGLLMAVMRREMKGLDKGKGFLTIRNLHAYGYYMGVLLKEIILSNIQVAKIVLHPIIEISPTVITYETKLKTAFHRTIFANSITLTPGTLTVLLENQSLTIHCLRKEYAEQIQNSALEKILLRIEEQENDR